ncbi:MAG: universal stress protein [Bacteroidales bacterium]|nr:universal stress protein [Bacteroidales bacterium]
MKTLILSDINHNNSGIIPYALRFCQDINSDVRVVHVVDTRDNQGIYSAYSASQNVTPEVQSFDEIIRKETKKSEDYVAKHVGREVSVINFQGKIEHEVIVGQLDEIITRECSNNDISLLVMAATPEGDDWSTTDDIFYLVAHTPVPVLLLPSGISYTKPGKAFYVASPKEQTHTEVEKAIGFTRSLNIPVEAMITDGNKEQRQFIKNENDWKTVAESTTGFHVIDSTDEMSIHEFARRKDAGMLLIFEKKRNILQRVVNKSLTEKLSAITEIPVLVFYN